MQNSATCSLAAIDELCEERTDAGTVPDHLNRRGFRHHELLSNFLQNRIACPTSNNQTEVFEQLENKLQQTHFICKI